MVDQTGEVEELERVLTDTSFEPIEISYTTIRYITKDFATVIGTGGFGEVYLGGLQNGMIAVKKLSQSMDLSDKQFLDELTCLRKVKHTNIVRFLGNCADTQGKVMEVEGKYKVVEVPQRLLCFEYVPNGNLHHYLKEKTYGYEWSVRYQIIKGICQGLHYIHHENIYHLDLKPANVLLGDNMEPKITDFGVSRCMIGKESTMVTQKAFGTLGYMAPEFIREQKISIKSDMFSLGVIMINLLTGSNGFVKDWHEAVDVDCGPQMKTCIIDIATRCVDNDPHKRPSTGDIIRSLNETEIIDHASQTYKLKIKEPRNDPLSSLHQVVQRFRALPAVSLREQAARGDPLYMELDALDRILLGIQEPGKLSYYLLQFITENFSPKREIGQTTFACIFRGTLRQREVAVKKLFITRSLNHQLFCNEVQAMMLTQHKNIVQFLGYCSYTEEEAMEYEGKFIMAEIRQKLLCFEYIRKGDLGRYISDASCGLEWRERYQIIKGICEGAHYLHGKNIVHMDLKPANILLDDNMVPKIANFYLSRCIHENQSRTHTTNLARTLAYTAPEHVHDGIISSKCDIYSLGIIITEILTGRMYSAENENILESWRTRLGTSSTDTLLEQVRICQKIGIACKDHEPKKRPDMQRIIEMLAETERRISMPVCHAEAA